MSEPIYIQLSRIEESIAKPPTLNRKFSKKIGKTTSDQIPIETAKSIAVEHGYDQVVIVARRVGVNGLEWCTTYGKTPEHCEAAARIGDAIRDNVTPTLERLTAENAPLTRQLAVAMEGLREILDTGTEFSDEYCDEFGWETTADLSDGAEIADRVIKQVEEMK